MLFMYLTMLDTEEDKSIFKKLYNDNKNIMYNFAYGILKDVPSAEDAVHDAFLSAAKNIDKISKMNCIQSRNYMIIIVKNVAFKIYNKRKKEFAVEEVYNEKETIDFSIETDIENRDIQKRVFEMIKNMDSKYSDVLILRYYYNMREDEIAESLDISKSNVKIRIHRAKEKIAKMIKEGGLYE